MKLKYIIFIIISILSLTSFAYVEYYSIDVIDQDMKEECEDYLSETKLGEQRCCQIGWTQEFIFKHPLDKCVILT